MRKAVHVHDHVHVNVDVVVDVNVDVVVIGFCSFACGYATMNPRLIATRACHRFAGAGDPCPCGAITKSGVVWSPSSVNVRR